MVIEAFLLLNEKLGTHWQSGGRTDYTNNVCNTVSIIREPVTLARNDHIDTVPPRYIATKNKMTQKRTASNDYLRINPKLPRIEPSGELVPISADSGETSTFFISNMTDSGSQNNAEMTIIEFDDPSTSDVKVEVKVEQIDESQICLPNSLLCMEHSSQRETMKNTNQTVLTIAQNNKRMKVYPEKQRHKCIPCSVLDRHTRVRTRLTCSVCQFGICKEKHTITVCHQCFEKNELLQIMPATNGLNGKSTGTKLDWKLTRPEADNRNRRKCTPCSMLDRQPRVRTRLQCSICQFGICKEKHTVTVCHPCFEKKQLNI